MKERRGFTLIELLVVIAIIAILAAILFPVFAKARDRAKVTECLSNLKQIGTAVNMYADDSDGYLFPQFWANGEWNYPLGACPPSSAAATSKWPYRLWATAYVPYTGNSYDVFRCSLDASMPKALQFNCGPNVAEAKKSVSYVYAGMDLWKAGVPAGANINASPRKFMRKITDQQNYKDLQDKIEDVGWVARDKIYLGPKGLERTVHGEAKGRSGEDALNGLASNVLLFDSSVKWRGKWTG
jgi:prepilin-type N-terminal cleavage/methylation domain-containing protein